jgi:hypothetical protein
LEREADLGRWVLSRTMDPADGLDPVVALVHAGNAEAVRAWCRERNARIAELQRAYRAGLLPEP